MSIFFKIIISVVIFFLYENLYSQTLFLLPTKTTNNVKDSIVETTVEEKNDSLWKECSTCRKVYSYNRKGQLLQYTFYKNKYIVKYKNKKAAYVIVYNNKKKESKYIYYYNESGQVIKIAYYIFLNNKKEYWGTEYIDYDIQNRIVSSSYIVDNVLSGHNGYSHGRYYEYNEKGLLEKEYRGYKETTYYYNQNNIIDYCFEIDREFGGYTEKKITYKISFTKRL